MNKAFRLIWNSTKEYWIVVAETVKSCGTMPFLIMGSVALMAAMLCGAIPARALDPAALPTGGQIVAGSGSIAWSGSAMTVTQTTNKMVANWSTFNIGQNASVAFQQPNVASVALNRIADQNPSQIMGSLSANGQVFLLNPSGIIFGQTVQVNVGALVASSLNLTNENFLNSNYRFESTGTAGAVINQGVIRTADGGCVAFLAPQVKNEGSIIANQGSVVMAAADKVNLDFTGDGLLSYSVEQGAVDALAENKGLIKADGGLVVMTAKAVDNLTQSVVNNDGIIEAQTIANKAGRIMLLSDMEHGETIVGGRLDASAPDGGDGGFIETSAAKVSYRDGFFVTAGSVHGTGGLWLIDPADAVIDQGIADGYAVTLNTGTSVLNEITGNITLNSGVNIAKTAGGDATLTFKATGNVLLNANSSISSSNGKLNTILWADSDGNSAGGIKLEGSSGNTATITTNGGHLWMGGGSGTPTWNGLTVGDGYAVDYLASDRYAGVFLKYASVNTNGGDVAIYGKAVTSASKATHEGIYLNHTTIDSGAGAITLDGQVANTVNNGSIKGIETVEDTFIKSASDATTAITVTGTSNAVSGTELFGLKFGWQTNSFVATGSGGITLTGQSAAGEGVYIAHGTNEILSQSGPININGSSVSLGDIWIGQKAGSAVETSNSAITITADNLNLNLVLNQTHIAASGGSGTLTIKPYTANKTIGLAGGSGDLNIDATEWSYIENGFSGIIIGSTTAGAISVGGTVTYNDPLTLKTAGNITMNAGSSFTGTAGQNASLMLWADADATNGGYIRLGQTAPITTNGGHLWLGGGSGSTVWNGLTVGDGYAQGTTTMPHGIYIDDGVITTSGGNIAMYGKSAVSGVYTLPPDTQPNASGIYSSFNNQYGISAGTGTIYLNAVGLNQTGDYLGDALYLNGGTMTSAAAAGDAITLIGDGSAANTGAGTRAAGITVIGWDAARSNTILASGGGNIVMTGTGTDQAAQPWNYGIRVAAIGAGVNAITTIGGAGNITLTGTANDSLASSSVGFEAANDRIASSGNLIINGTGKAVDLLGQTVVSGTTTLTAAGQNITANNARNNFTGAVSFTGANVNLRDTNALILGASTVSGNLTLQTGGALTQTGALAVTGTTGITAGAGNSVTLNDAANDFTGAVSVVSGANVSIIDSNAMTLVALTATGTVDIATLTDDLTLTGAVSTGDTTASAVTLNADKNTVAGTSTGGNIIVNGGSVTVGAGGTAKLFSGSVSGSTGLTALVGSGSGNFRYNSDETNTNYTTALATAKNAIYREQPTVTTTASNDTKVYSGVAYSGGNGVTCSGFANGDTSAALGGALAYGGTSQGATAVGSYLITPSGYSNGLGYALAYANGTLSITGAPAPAPIPANPETGNILASINSPQQQVNGTQEPLGGNGNGNRGSGPSMGPGSGSGIFEGSYFGGLLIDRTGYRNEEELRVQL